MRYQKGYTIIELIISIAVGIVILGLLALIPITFKACSQLTDEISSVGLKGVVSELWEGDKKSD